jgi:hypothetical protein
LVDNAESLGGLQLDTNTPPVQVKSSLDTSHSPIALLVGQPKPTRRCSTS